MSTPLSFTTWRTIMDMMYLTHEQHEAIVKLFVGVVFFSTIFILVICKMKWWSD